MAGRRILLVTNWVGWGGAETQLDYLSIGLREAGWEVEMLAIGEALRDTSALEAAGVVVTTLGATRPPAKARVLPEVVRHARRADMVHCTGWDATFWGRLAAIAARKPVAITEHTPGRDLQVTDEGSSRARLIKLHNRLLARATAATIIVGVWQRALLEGEGVDGSRIVHIPNAVPIATLRERAANGPTRADLGIPEDALVVVEVARFYSQKRQRAALAAVAELRGRLGRDVRLVFVGDGPEEPDVKAEAERIGADWASFLGRREPADVPGLISLSDLSVLPSTGEGLPMSLIESIVLRTPTVATDVGDVRWLLETTGGGICVPPSDDPAFVDACAELLSDPALRERMVEQGAQAADRFDQPRMVAAYAEVFEAVIDKAPFPQPSQGG